MKLSVQQKYINIALHALVWGALLLLPYLVSTAENDFHVGILPGLFFSLAMVVHMGLFYGNAFYLYPKLANRRWWWLYIITSILLIMAASRLKYVIALTWFPEVLSGHLAGGFVFGSTIPFYIASLIYRRIADGVRKEREQKERQAAQLLTELKFLRSQISPHFLFNVLTNMVSLARKKSDRLEAALIMLADLMRYMLYDTQGKKVPLQKEIDYLNSYISLQQLRFGNEPEISCRIGAVPEGYEIEPMLLIPFVENAFKHGSGFIDISLDVKDGWMTFEVVNKFQDETTASKDGSSGIGLENVETRLRLLYRHRHTLALRNENNLFHITLTLKLT
jgi:sensor histidine kinase YesM